MAEDFLGRRLTMKKDSTSYGAERPAWDKNDCSIRALATATGCGYAQASMIFTAAGRTLRQGTTTALSQEVYEKWLGMIPLMHVEGMSLGEFARLAHTGNFIVHKFMHAFAVIDGVVHDWEGTSRDATKVVRAWRVTPATRAKLAKFGAFVA